jgi:HK97 gp10 family phage protein
MAKRASTRVVLNRSKLHQVRLAVADGMMEVGRTVVETASEQAPDSPYDPYPTGEGLPKQGGVWVGVDNAKVDGWHIRGGQPRKPTAARGGKGIVAIAGFGFPGRFAEFGTARTAAQPFLTPAARQVEPHIRDILRSIVDPALDRMS